ncbi:ubiquitin-specific protease ubp15 [Mycoemilia scoparia]|uniref:ubiquitinyl hydrolase 1 n=1 Tax=Mycoemilia scoparia TaxID=417184 RepID=A0A9W8DV23_9FUNG|nr:ubiquitin-specific protease ubp15 [Mycoemilia scoparia]
MEEKPGSQSALSADDISEQATPAPLSILDSQEFVKGKFQPKNSLKIADFQVFHWEIDWNALEKRTTGPVFEAGGHKWNVLLFPQGNQVQGVASLFLEYTDADTSPEGWGVCADFCLAISNIEKPDVYHMSRTEHRFCADESDWGFSQYYRTDLLSQTTDSKGPIMTGNKFRISVYIRVLDDPTGVLWHNFKNYDSRKVTGYIGVDNQGATCYMNSLLQSLYFTNEFRRSVYKVPTENDKPAQSVTLALQQVFHDLQLSPDTVNTIELTKSFGWDTQESFRQHDVQEFNRVLQDHLENKMKGTAVDGAIGRLFLGKMKSYIRCLNVDFESSRIEDYYDISLNVKGCKTLRDSFVDYCQVETLEGENKYMAENHGLQDAKKGMVFMSFPPVLHLQLKRFEYDFMYDRMIKINDRFEFPFEIDLEEFLDSGADRSEPCVYRLHGVLIHSGDVSGGHYFAFLRPTENKKWYRFDDDRVVPVLEDEVIDESYGGDIGSGNVNNNGPTRPSGGFGAVTRSTHKKITNAYMLVYIRSSQSRKILDPVDDSEIPIHVIKRSQEAKAEEERRRQELAEKQRTVNVTIVDDSDFRTHQMFDMCDFGAKLPGQSKLYSKRFPRTMRYSEFKEAYAQEKGLKVDEIRFWAIVGRVNKTIRVDSPITEPNDLMDIDDQADQTLEKIFQDNFKKWSELRLYCEHMDKWVPNGRFPACDSHSERSMVFIKYFDQPSQKIEGLGKIYISAKSQIKEIIPLLKAKKGLADSTEIDLYEEIKPYMIEKMNTEITFQQSEIQSGDIICFQPTQRQELSSVDGVVVEKDEFDRILPRTIPEFFDRLTRKVPVFFGKSLADSDAESSEDEPNIPDSGDIDWNELESRDKTRFTLYLFLDDTYDTVAKEVAKKLGVDDPLRIQFSHNASEHPYEQNQVIRRSPDTTLDNMIFSMYVTEDRLNFLSYEILPMSIVDMEKTAAIPVVYLGGALRDEQTFKVRVSINQTAQAIVDEIYSRVANIHLKSKIQAAPVNTPDMPNDSDALKSQLLPKPTVEPAFTLRIYHEVKGYSISPIEIQESVTKYIQDGSVLYAELLPSVSDQPLAQENDPKKTPKQYGDSKVIRVFHFTNQLRNVHGVPFFFTIFRDEPWEETWHRIQLKLGMGKRDFTKVKPVIVPEGASSIDSCRYLLDGSSNNGSGGNARSLGANPTMPGAIMSPTPETTPRSGSPALQGEQGGESASPEVADIEDKSPTSLWEELSSDPDNTVLGLDYVERSNRNRRTEKSIHIRG